MIKLTMKVHGRYTPLYHVPTEEYKTQMAEFKRDADSTKIGNQKAHKKLQEKIDQGSRRIICGFGVR